MIAEEEQCPHLYVVGDTACRICLAEVRGQALTDVSTTPGNDDDGVDWGGVETPEAAATWSPEEYPATGTKPIYPEYPPLQEAPISINFKITGEPMITVRGFDGHQITALLNDLEEHGVWANLAAAQASLRAQGQLGAGLGPMSAPGAPAPAPAPQAAPYGAPPQATPPPFGPNVSVPQAPGYQGPPPQQSYPSAPQQGWGGAPGGGNYQQNNNRQAEAQAQPPGWFRTNARSGPGFDAWKNMREMQKDYLKGKIKWGGKADYWIEPSIAQWLAQQGWPVTQ